MRRCFVIFVLTVAFCSLCVLYYVTPRTVSNLAIYTFTDDADRKTILYWNTFFNEEDFYLGMGYVARDCPIYNNCFATHNRFLRSVEDFDAIVFHGINGELSTKDLPDRRRPSQKYVFVALESPVNRYIGPEFDGYFNVTATYHFDSDIVWTYANIVDRDNESLVAVPSAKEYFEWKVDESMSAENEGDEDRIIKGKKDLAIWYRSNCNTRGRREAYVAELEKHMPVASYGSCSSANPGCRRDQDCFKSEVEPRYFFYLSFENSLCEDYITEKFFNALNHSVVPVVYGGANYSRFAPPNSYINALDFDSPQELAKYLILLSKDVRAYKKYFHWKRHYRIISPKQRVICDLCQLKIQSSSFTVSTSFSQHFERFRIIET
ncbi:alpha-(1,3)-fucosyltransferase C isoform X2 [Copidosoma floridanum]|uniref:alpha-(1,3)-fucosyltransferase C isoform X2 n=1 Tax=Copidosoma floridanum TaxID=29053 RepID=UPI0006C9B135|nr:alpha-(1,3)-fucosyltransferase C isoform X2 [Copidosoma floridanum]